MMDYKEMAAIVKERGDAIIAEKAERSRRIKRITSYASGLAVAAAAAFCIWQNNSTGLTPSLNNVNSNVICETTSSVTSRDAEVTTAAERASENTSAKPTNQKTTSAQTGSVATDLTPSPVRMTSQAAGSAVNENSSIRSDNAGMAPGTTFVPVRTTEAVTAYDYETTLNEGRIIMKHFAALSAALIAATNTVPAFAAESEPYTRVSEQINEINSIKTCIDELGMDIDLNCDGKIDIFDCYAAARVYYPEECPDYINEKADACKRIIEEYKNDTDKYISIADIIPYFIEYYPIKSEYFDPDFYIENCPDTYAESVPLEYIGKEGGVHDIVELYETMNYSKEGEGYVALNYLELRYGNNSTYIKHEVPRVYDFIEYWLRHNTQYTTAWYNFLGESIENGFVDADINSDGKFDYDDIMLLEFFEEYFYDKYTEAYSGVWDDNDVYHEADSVKLHKERRTYEGFLDYYDSMIWLGPNAYFDNHRLSENEWSKAMKFFDTTLLYNYNSCDVIDTLFTYYIINNKVDFAIFDNDYYNNRPDAYIQFRVRGRLNSFKKIAETYGVNKIRDPEEEPVDLRFIRYDVEEMFPEYYAKVKGGELPEPDINRNGQIDIQDYAFFQDIFYEFPAPGDPSYFTYVTIDAPQYVRDAFNNDYDFNNNGVSCDFGELECIELYIAKALGAADYDDVLDMLNEYYAEHPEYDRMLILNEIIAEKNEEYENSNNTETASDSEVPEDNENYTRKTSIRTYMKTLDLFADVKGDANCNGTVDVADAVAVLQYLTNSTKYPLSKKGIINADIDGAKGITGSDATAIQRIDAGIWDES